jgi:hypothetical protein
MLPERSWKQNDQREIPHFVRNDVVYLPQRNTPHAKWHVGQENEKEDELDAEGTTAAAGGLDVGIVKLEASAFESFDIIDLDTIEIHGAHLVDSDLESIEVDDFVSLVGLIFKRHVILETGAASTDHRNAQGDRDGILHTHDFLNLSGGNGGQINHNYVWPPLAEFLRKLNSFSV